MGTEEAKNLEEALEFEHQENFVCIPLSRYAELVKEETELETIYHLLELIPSYTFAETVGQIKSVRKGVVPQKDGAENAPEKEDKNITE